MSFRADVNRKGELLVEIITAEEKEKDAERSGKNHQPPPPHKEIKKNPRSSKVKVTQSYLTL